MIEFLSQSVNYIELHPKMERQIFWKMSHLQSARPSRIADPVALPLQAQPAVSDMTTYIYDCSARKMLLTAEYSVHGLGLCELTIKLNELD